MAGGGEVHTCSDTSLALAAKQKQTLSGEASRLLPAPRASRAPRGPRFCRAGTGPAERCALGLLLPPRCLRVGVHGAQSCLLTAARPWLLSPSSSPSSSSSSPPSGRPAPHQELAQRRGVSSRYSNAASAKPGCRGGLGKAPAVVVLCCRASGRKTHTYLLFYYEHWSEGPRPSAGGGGPRRI